MCIVSNPYKSLRDVLIPIFLSQQTEALGDLADHPWFSWASLSWPHHLVTSVCKHSRGWKRNSPGFSQFLRLSASSWEGSLIRQTSELPGMLLHHLKYTYHTVHLPQSLPSVEMFSESIKNTRVIILPPFDPLMVRAYYLCSLDGGTWSYRETRDSSMSGLVHTFIFLSVTFFTVIDHCVCLGRWLNGAATSVRLSRDETSYLRGRKEMACHSSCWGPRFPFNRTFYHALEQPLRAAVA